MTPAPDRPLTPVDWKGPDGGIYRLQFTGEKIVSGGTFYAVKLADGEQIPCKSVRSQRDLRLEGINCAGWTNTGWYSEGSGQFYCTACGESIFQ